MMIVLIAAAIANVPSRQTIGVYQHWAAFSDGPPRRCYAITAPVGSRGSPSVFVGVATWPPRQRNSFYVRLSRPAAASARLTISIGERRFELAGRGADAWATDADSNRAIIAALRDGRSMSVEAVAVNGRPFADSYRLAGAASAIDAAALACLGK